VSAPNTNNTDIWPISKALRCATNEKKEEQKKKNKERKEREFMNTNRTYTHKQDKTDS